MKKKLIGVSIAVTIFAILLLYQGIYYLNSSLQFYLQCLNEKAAGALPYYYSCGYHFTDVQLILMPIALFGIAIWLGYWGIRGKLSVVLHFRAIIPVLAAATTAILTLILRGIMLFFHYLDCVSRCPSGTCGGAAGTDPGYTCTFPFMEFVLPLVIIGIASVIIASYGRKRISRVHSSPTPDGT